MLEWKENRSDKYALLIKGARRVGKSTIAEEFARKEFKSYILIDFAHTSKTLKELFDDTYDLDFFFLQLQQLTGTRLYENESVIIFDEVQLLPQARQAIKYLVADGRYKYIETGYVGGDGRLYCVYEYKEEIDVFTAPEEIIANQLGNHMPIAIKERKTE